MLFQKWGCLVGPENSIFRKLKSVDLKKMPLTTEINLHFYFPFKAFPENERERERERARAHEEKIQSGIASSSSSLRSRSRIATCHDRDLGSRSRRDRDRDRLSSLIFFLGCGLCFSGFVFSFFLSKHQKIFSGKFFEMQPNTEKYFPFLEISISWKIGRASCRERVLMSV